MFQISLRFHAWPCICLIDYGQMGTERSTLERPATSYLKRQFSKKFICDNCSRIQLFEAEVDVNQRRGGKAIVADGGYCGTQTQKRERPLTDQQAPRLCRRKATKQGDQLT